MRWCVVVGFAVVAVCGSGGPAGAGNRPLTAGPCFHVAATSNGRQFYVSPDGDDANPGTAPDCPWRTLAKVNAADLGPGDRVHLRGNATFVEPLAPYSGMSGSRRTPIVFDSYGGGAATLRGGIYLNSVSDLSFSDFSVRAPSGKGIFSSAHGAGAKRIVLRNITISDAPLAGISSNNRSDDYWLIDDVRISRTGDSGIYFVGSGFTVTNSTIQDTGRDPQIGYPRHGIYAVGAHATLTHNVIRRFSTSGISLRRQSGRVEGNRISNGAKGISFDDEATARGTTRVVHNSISRLSDSGIAIASAAREAFLLANNTITAAGRFGVYVGAVRKLIVANNIVAVRASAAGVLAVRRSDRRYREHHNLWHGGPSAGFFWNGSPRTFASYVSVSGQGRGDLVRNPSLATARSPTG